MNLDSLSFALSQISYSVANLTKKNYKANINEISHLVAQYGPEADRHLARCLFSHVDFSGDGRSSGKDYYQTQYLIQECAALISKPNFVSTLCYALDHPLHQQKSLRPSPHLFGQLSRILKLTSVQEVAVGLAALSSSNTETHKHAVQFVRQKLPQLLNSYIDAGSSSGEGGGLRDTPIEVVHLLLSHLLSDSDSESFGVTATQKEAFFKTLSKDFPRGKVPVVLEPLLYPEIRDVPLSGLHSESVASQLLMMTESLADALLELGPGVTKTAEQCRATLQQLGVAQLTSASVARVLGLMSRHPIGQTDINAIQSLLTTGGSGWPDIKESSTTGSTPLPGDSWNVEVFVDIVKELKLTHVGIKRSCEVAVAYAVAEVVLQIAPNTSWTDVVRELDHPGFLVNSKAGLELLHRGLFRYLTPDTFPVDVLYSLWKNKEGQLSLIGFALKNLDVFNLDSCSHRSVVIDVLKSCPDDDSREVRVWKSLDLIDILIQLAEGFHGPVWELFKSPIQLCPDLLVLGLLQCTRWNNMKKDLLSALIPMFLGNHPNSAPVLQSAWHSSTQSHSMRTLILHSMADWYMRGEPHDQARLSRILDVAQDLKALSNLLNASSFAFVIDLACLASRREYLKLDKWLTDKMREHGETFVQACANFLVVRCPQLTGAIKEDQPTPQSKSQQLPPETINTMLSCLQLYLGVERNVTQELQENIVRLVNNGTVLLKAKQMLPGVVGLNPRGNLPPSQIPGLPGPLGGQIDPLMQMNAMAMAGPNQQLSGVGSIGPGYPGNLAASLSVGPPGSPAKSFTQQLGPMPPQPQPSQQSAFNNYQALSSQLQGLNLHGGLGSTGIGPTIGTGLGSGFGTGLGTGAALTVPTRGTPSLGMLSTQALAAQQPSSLRAAVNPANDISNLLAVGGAGANAASGPVAGSSATIPSQVSQQQQPQQFSKEIEDEANSYFKRIYNTSGTAQHPAITIDQIIDILKSFKDSQNEKDKDVFQCFLRNLFEEYRFFSEYPDKELHTTALLFGSIIEHGLVTYMALGVALRYVLEALKKRGTKMHMFGLTALDRFKTRLKEYPQYCAFLTAIPHFGDFPVHIKEYIEYGSRSQDPPSAAVTQQLPTSIVASSMPPVSSSPAVTTPSTTSTASSTAPQTTHGAISRPAGTGSTSKPSVANATNIDTLLANKEGIDCVKVPPEAMQDKVFFIFNNLSMANMDQKAVELLECTGDEYMPWVAQYLVMKRASIEQNFHTLYANFIDQLKKSEFLTMVVSETYRNIKVLLRCDKGVANYSDRTLLKNLGHWLGLLTLAKNKPVLHREMDVKGLIYEAYHKGAQELLYVIPFVAKILESAARSRVFRPPNPWTMAIMNVLAELHREPEMKLNLKFEIEVLCKNLQIDINDLMPSNYLKDVSRLDTLENQLSAPSHAVKDGSTPQPEEPLQILMPTPAVAMGAGVMMPPPPQTVSALPPSAAALSAAVVSMTAAPPAQHHQQPQFGFSEISSLTLPGLLSHVIINEQAALFQLHPQLKVCVKPAIERAVQEMLAPAIERATKIALTTSEQIVKKDFALDPDESRMRQAAHHLVRFMTAGMALITCHEPVLISISSQLKTAFLQLLGGATTAQKDMIEHAAQLIAQDNAELATAFLQKTAVEKAIPEIDKRLTNEYELRKIARSEGRRYCDPTVLTYQAERMPEQIRLQVGGVTVKQITVYEEFSRCIPGFIPMGGTPASAGGSTDLSTAPGSVSDLSSGHPGAPFMPKTQLSVMPQLAAGAGADDVIQIYERLYREIEQHLAVFQSFAEAPQQLIVNIRTLLEYLVHARQAIRDGNAAMNLVQQAVEGLLQGYSNPPGGPEQELMARYRDCHIVILRAMQEIRMYGPQLTNKKVTQCLESCRDDLRYNIDAVDLLIHSQLVVLPRYDLRLATQLENGLNFPALVFATKLVQRFCTDLENLVVRLPESEFGTTIEALTRIAFIARQPPEGPLVADGLDMQKAKNPPMSAHAQHSQHMRVKLNQLLEALRQNTEGALIDRVNINPPPMMHSGIIQAREFEDPPGLHEKTEFLLREWVGLYHSPTAGLDSSKAFSTFVAQMHIQGILKTDDLITRFFRLCTEMCVDLCYRALSEPSQVMTRVRVQCFHTLDAFVRLIQLLLRHSGDNSSQHTKINLLNKVLGIVAGVLLQDHEVRHTDFQQLPYHRVLIMLFIELNSPEPILESINFEILQAFCNILHILRPVKAPGFAYAWLELVSHRVFISRVLAQTPQQRAWGMYATLLIDLFKFLAPFLRNAELTKPAQLLYKGTMRVLLVLLHDFPEFLCEYHYAFCDVIPSNCIQVRNLVLSAFPRNMRLPDPFTPNLKVDMLPDITHVPRVMSNFVHFIQPQSFKKEVDTYLKTRAPVTFISELRSKLQVSSTPGVKYNIPMMNALVLYVGTQAIQYITSKGLTPSMSTIAHSSHMDIFQNLAVDMDTEGRYLFLNAVANQLRYPNSHTHYFSCTLLYLFVEANSEAIQEQITRVLLERLIVNRPHPWGLLITFIELIKNPQFKFWNHEFVHCAPEIERLLESVARSCMQTKPSVREAESVEVR